METINFDNILTVAEADVKSISPPGYVQHDSGTTYFYVIRRANHCGDQEHTLAAAVRVAIDVDGELVQPQPNGIFGVKAEQTDGGKVRLMWLYCPIEQDSEPAFFKIYYDDKTGQIDYENPVATVSYKGRRFYSYQSDALEAGSYLFAVRVEDTAGTQDSSLARIRIQLDITGPDTIDILSAGTA